MEVLPFGLTSATATFQRLVEQVISGLHWKTFPIYLGDVWAQPLNQLTAKRVWWQWTQEKQQAFDHFKQ